MNEDAVIKAAKRKLSKCRSLMRQSGKRLSDLQSPSFDGMPKGTPSGNRVEDSMIRRIDAENSLRDIIGAINMCSERSKEILFDLYFDLGDYSDTQVRMNEGRTESTFYRSKRQALWEFAETYHFGEMLNTANSERILTEI
ncbi:ArpU family phage packaging/lysis transcriptional regulator [Furfurilactobacillus sp. WILCCON 0119]